MLKQLRDIKDGDIIEIECYTGGYCFDRFDGVFNKSDETLTRTDRYDKFDFNNHNYHEIEFELNVIGNINNYKYNEKEVNFENVFRYLYIDKGLDDISYKIYDDSSSDIGYFEQYPVNIVEIRENLISHIAFGRGKTQNGLNQDLLSWLYYLKDMNIKIKI